MDMGFQRRDVVGAADLSDGGTHGAGLSLPRPVCRLPIRILRDAALAMLSVIFYGVFLGGLVLVGTLGAIAAVLTAKLLNPASKHRKRVVFIAALGVTTVCLLVLANLDKMIGPW